MHSGDNGVQCMLAAAAAPISRLTARAAADNASSTTIARRRCMAGIGSKAGCGQSSAGRGSRSQLN